MLSLTKKAGALISAVLTAIGLVPLAFGKDHHPASFFLILGLTLGVVVLGWQLFEERRSRAGEVESGVNISKVEHLHVHMGPGGATAESPPGQSASPSLPAAGGEIDLPAYYREHVQNAVLESPTFRNATIRGPAVIFPMGDITMLDLIWPAPGNDPDGLFIELREGREWLTGVLPIRNPTFQGCEVLDVAIAGFPRDLARLRAKMLGARLPLGHDSAGGVLRVSAAGERRPSRWTQAAVLDAIREFAAKYGRPPSAIDWNVAACRARPGWEWRAERFYADGSWPHLTTVTRMFGGWNAALEAAGLQPRPADGSYARVSGSQRSVHLEAEKQAPQDKPEEQAAVS